MNANSFLALIPAYNEGTHIAKVVTGTRAHLAVLVVDDGSTADTAGRVEAAGATELCQSPNQDKGAALRAGFARALEAGYQAVLTLDADGQRSS
jgi:glycosyltransferase involved in cell wall biosynthesis